MKGINESKLIQQVKKAAKSKLIWQRKEDFEYIASNNWVVRTASTVGTKTRSALFEIFGQEVQVNQALAITRGHVSLTELECEKFYVLDKAKLAGRLTPVVILKQEFYPTMRMVVIGEHLLAIDNEYAEMVEDTDALGVGLNDPIFLGSNHDILILPYRKAGSWRNELESLMPGVYK